MSIHAASNYNIAIVVTILVTLDTDSTVPSSTYVRAKQRYVQAIHVGLCI